MFLFAICNAKSNVPEQAVEGLSLSDSFSPHAKNSLEVTNVDMQ